MNKFLEDLWNINRSITGQGIKQTLKYIQDNFLPTAELHSIQSSKSILDWYVPEEWNIYDAWIKDSKGKKIIDFKVNHLHVLGYSVPLLPTKFHFQDLKTHLYYDKEHPDWIPYRCSYFSRNWGFCLSYNQFKKMEKLGENEVYTMMIDSKLDKLGEMNYLEMYLPGESEKEYVFSTYACHPNLGNDNLSGLMLNTFLAKEISQQQKRKYSYRFLFVPETIGTIAWLAKNQYKLRDIQEGMSIACVGAGDFHTLKKSRQGNSHIDRIVQNLFLKKNLRLMEYKPTGADERQWNTINVNKPFSVLARNIFASYPEYHTSADNKSYITIYNVKETLEHYKQIIHCLENNKTYKTDIIGEPQLGRRNLHRSISGKNTVEDSIVNTIWFFNLLDGKTSLLDIAEKINASMRDLIKIAHRLEKENLIYEVEDE